MQTDNLELKKLVYLYLMNYAKSQPDLAIMAVNTFVKVRVRFFSKILRTIWDDFLLAGLRRSESSHPSVGCPNDGLYSSGQDHRIFVRTVEEMLERRRSVREENGGGLRGEVVRYQRPVGRGSRISGSATRSAVGFESYGKLGDESVARYGMGGCAAPTPYPYCGQGSKVRSTQNRTISGGGQCGGGFDGDQRK